MMEFADIQSIAYDAFYGLLNEYYREGEDAQTAQEEIDAFKTSVLRLCATEYARLGWTMQLHFGAIRNNNRRMFEATG